jgi:hypothetical protein
VLTTAYFLERFEFELGHYGHIWVTGPLCYQVNSLLADKDVSMSEHNLDLSDTRA